MGYKEIYSKDIDEISERYEIVSERVAAIAAGESLSWKNDVPANIAAFEDYFSSCARILTGASRVFDDVRSGKLDSMSLEENIEYNHSLFEELSIENYEKSWANYGFATEQLGDDFGKLLCFLYAELRAAIVYAFEERIGDITLLNELFVQVYSCFDDEWGATVSEVDEVIRYFYHDYSEVFVEQAVRDVVDPELDFFTKIVMESDLSDERYLFKYGEYIDQSTIRFAKFINSMSEDAVKKIADTYTEGYRIGFEVTGKDLSRKKTVDVRYPIGMERIARQAIYNFEKMGLRPTIYRSGFNAMTGRGVFIKGVFTKQPNRQFEFDHKNDKAAFLDKAFVARRLEVLTAAYENYKDLAKVHAGPAVIETFGEIPFDPKPCDKGYSYDKRQQELNVEYASKAGGIVNKYIPGEERSFTIISFPTPDVGDEFEKIFEEIVKINTLDYKLYQNMQQKIIDVLNCAEYVRVKGRGENKTDITVQLYPTTEPEKQTKFENCVADVNIPVGEVFTSPVLKGTEGVLHVSQVYLNELCYKNLELHFKDGMVTDYSCTNFEDQEKGRAYIKENVLYHHDTLPIGEFAIGTNTTAYRVSRDMNIEKLLPILIAEKTGPHFAVGDTCYSHCEDTVVYNPDGKEIVARDNECSIRRKDDDLSAYFNCHTDVTIPYDELDSIIGYDSEGREYPIIQNGLFVVPGTEELNIPLKNN